MYRLIARYTLTGRISCKVTSVLEIKRAELTEEPFDCGLVSCFFQIIRFISLTFIRMPL